MSQLNVLIIGAGGREHAILNQLLLSPTVAKIFITQGNGGTHTISHPSIEVVNVPIGASKKDFPELLKFAIENDVRLVIPGPEQPLIDGIVDYFQFNNYSGKPIAVFGPNAKAAVMEGSKTFSKDFMAKHSIPTAEYKNFDKYEAAKEYINSVEHRIVIKASGIAAGKGVLIPTTKEEAMEALDDIMVKKKFGSAGDEIVIEEFMDGDEISILTLSDGYSFVNLPPSQDHKKIGNDDTGLNTGGMGSYAPTPIASDPKLLQKINDTIVKPTIDGMRQDGFPFVGVLFTGIILLNGEPKVLEYNVRFGDPETQSVLPLINSNTTDLAQVFLAAAEGRLDSVNFEVDNSKFATTVVLAANGYPEAYEKNNEITVDHEAIKQLNKNVSVVHAGTKFNEQGKVVTNGGRVLGVTSVANDLKQSVANVYEAINHVNFKEKYFRTDIAHRAFKHLENKTTKKAITYEDSGVSVDNGNLLVENIKSLVKSTKRAGADSDIGGFGGLFDLHQAGYENSKETLLVAATDGVGTKLRIAQESNIHNTVGIDLVAMNVNDLVVQGAEPLFFLDYFATGKLDISIAHDFVSGVAEGCKISNCALVGGETSEMPGMYEGNHYDTNGTAVGAVLKDQMLPKIDDMAVGDVILGLGSDGLHSNGFSLVRKIIEVNELGLSEQAPWETSEKMTVAESCLIPTRIYVRPILKVLKSTKAILGLAHITGGGLVENLPRCLPKHLAGKIEYGTWPVPNIFKWFGEHGNVPIADFFKTFNAGIGMAVIVKAADYSEVQKIFEEAGEKVYKIGELVERGDKEGCFVDSVKEDSFYSY
ncbi:bifunctional aminoimidazole ribotide synthase/glycinamide ribotide synthase [Saccharomycopsis crataegensis]|uniref:Phosphoribosylformylglycinamidine cyclo-ligase n=1 Tax=Saccharomycopsis crataegensis TaxID=43959 RepID=A0AAV5QR26_9ASCO|nr:bifunctional aminoimidazole ribotide synthase/glycinamide ribotide synthase [Saccharomycopsis crataegensis]